MRERFMTEVDYRKVTGFGSFNRKFWFRWWLAWCTFCMSYARLPYALPILPRYADTHGIGRPSCDGAYSRRCVYTRHIRLRMFSGQEGGITFWWWSYHSDWFFDCVIHTCKRKRHPYHIGYLCLNLPSNGAIFAKNTIVSWKWQIWCFLILRR